MLGCRIELHKKYGLFECQVQRALRNGSEAGSRQASRQAGKKAGEQEVERGTTQVGKENRNLASEFGVVGEVKGARCGGARGYRTTVQVGRDRAVISLARELEEAVLSVSYCCFAVLFTCVRNMSSHGRVSSVLILTVL